MRILFLIMISIFSLPSSAQTLMKGWPDMEKGYEKGVSACYGGVLNGYLVMAGGANFAEKPAAEGGKKCFYTGIYAAKLNGSNSLAWKKVGELPEPMAYGTSITSQGQLIIIGGSNENGSLSTVYGISIKKGKTEIKKLPSLPIPADNTAGTTYGKKLYVGGGMSQGEENRKVFCLDLGTKNPKWEETKDFSGMASVQTVACIKDKKPLFLGGYSPKTTTHDAKVYDGPSGGALVQMDSGDIYTSGGVNHEIFLDAISGNYSMIDKNEYLLQPASWYKFDSKLQKYNAQSNTYKCVLQSADIARAGALMVTDGKCLFVIGGEIKPGIRTNTIIKIKL